MLKLAHPQSLRKEPMAEKNPEERRGSPTRTKTGDGQVFSRNHISPDGDCPWEPGSAFFPKGSHPGPSIIPPSCFKTLPTRPDELLQIRANSVTLESHREGNRTIAKGIREEKEYRRCKDESGWLEENMDSAFDPGDQPGWICGWGYGPIFLPRQAS